jgi:hypothetical protein
MNNTQDFYLGTLIIKLPDDNSSGITSNKNHSIKITSDELDAEQLSTGFKANVFLNIAQIDIKKIDPEFLKSTCHSGYCEIPVLRFQTLTENVLSLYDYKHLKTPPIVLKPLVSECNDMPTLNEYCKFIDKKLGCMGCKNPFMRVVINTAHEMQK